MNRIAQILSTGSYVPERVVTNAEIDALLGEETDAWLVENVGIRERRWMTPEQTTSDLVTEAARQALSDAGLSPADIDLLIVSTDTPDYLSPATSVVVQHKLGAVNAGCFDINSACAGWVTALDLGARYLATDPDMRYVLVAGGYGMSRFLDLKDKYTANLFADGAGAVVLGVGKEPGFLASTLAAQGAYHDGLGIYCGGAFRPCTPENLAQYGPPAVKFVRKFPKTFNLDNWPPLVRKTVSKAGLTLDDIDLFLFTQLNLRTIEAVMEALGQPLEKTHWVMDKWGYTGSPCVVMALDDAIRRGRGPRAGDHVLFCTSGGGISFAVSLWRWTVP
ncbi:MAG: ketoacyl-ACP synthase III [Caldilineae bacterium]|nr:MAG: ketoacyl-ACP synthase III [Caldilineae bacterium]